MNTTVSEGTGYSPYFLARGKHPRMAIHNETGKVIYDPEELNSKPSRELDMEAHYRRARDNLIKHAQKWANKEPKKVIPVFQEGDKVLILEMRKTPGLVQSLLDIYDGPYTVVKKYDFHTYKVVRDDNHADERVCPVHQLRKYHTRPPAALVDHSDLERRFLAIEDDQDQEADENFSTWANPTDQPGSL